MIANTIPYPGQAEAALSHVPLRIRPGEKVAILRRMGSGKSTIAGLILGLNTPADGLVLADGTDIKQFDPAAYRARIVADGPRGEVLNKAGAASGASRAAPTVRAV